MYEGPVCTDETTLFPARSGPRRLSRSRFQGLFWYRSEFIPVSSRVRATARGRGSVSVVLCLCLYNHDGRVQSRLRWTPPDSRNVVFYWSCSSLCLRYRYRPLSVYRSLWWRCLRKIDVRCDTLEIRFVITKTPTFLYGSWRLESKYCGTYFCFSPSIYYLGLAEKVRRVLCAYEV